MRFRKTMEQNGDTAGWGVMGTVTGFVLYTNWVEQAAAAALVAASGMLGSIIAKTLYNYIGRKVTSWWQNRKIDKITKENE